MNTSAIPIKPFVKCRQSMPTPVLLIFRTTVLVRGSESVQSFALNQLRCDVPKRTVHKMLEHADTEVLNKPRV